MWGLRQGVDRCPRPQVCLARNSEFSNPEPAQRVSLPQQFFLPREAPKLLTHWARTVDHVLYDRIGGK